MPSTIEFIAASPYYDLDWEDLDGLQQDYLVLEQDTLQVGSQVDNA